MSILNNISIDGVNLIFNDKYPMKQKSAFTIIEMLVVIFIVTIILWITMSFSGNRIQLLNNQNTKEEFISAYNEQFLIASNSNYIDWTNYDKLILSFSVWDDDFSYQYKKGDMVVKSGRNDVLWKIQIKQLFVWNESIQHLDIQLSPYELWCKFINGLNISKSLNASIVVSVNGNRKDYCFQISSQLWRLEECPSSTDNTTANPEYIE